MRDTVIKIKEIKLVDVEKLIPNPKNPNKHPDDQIKHLAKQYKYQGMRTPIIVSNRSGFIVAGHGRLEAAKEAKLKKVPVSYQDFETEAQEYAFMVADNSTSQWADLDLAKVNLDLPELGPDFDIEMLGIKNFALDPSDLGFNPSDTSSEKEAKTCPHCGEVI